MKILFALITVAVFSFGVEEFKITSEIKDNISNVITTLKSNEGDEIKKEKILSKISVLFDFETMSKISLGKKWKELNETQQKEFVTVFVKQLQNSFYEKLKHYSNELVKYKELDKPKPNRISFKTNIISQKGEVFEVIYKFYKDDKNDWKIYDVDMLGISLVQTYRVQIEEILNKDNGFENLMVKIQEKNN